MLSEALAIVGASGERWFEPELHRLMAEARIASTPSDPAEAEASLGRALVMAREQGARLWELRAATSLAKLRRDQVDGVKRAIFSRQSTAGSPRASIRRFCRRQRICSTNLPAPHPEPRGSKTGRSGQLFVRNSDLIGRPGCLAFGQRGAGEVPVPPAGLISARAAGADATAERRSGAVPIRA